MISGEYVKINGFKVHRPFFEGILKENGIELARHCNTNYRKEFKIRFVKSRFGETKVSFSLGGSKVIGSDSNEALEFYGNKASEAIEQIVKILNKEGIVEGVKVKKHFEKTGEVLV